MAKAKVSGVGPSKRFVAPNPPSAYDKLKGLHVGGIPIEDLDEELVARLSRQHTDEGIAERNAGKVDTAVRVTQSPTEKAIQRRGDFRREQREPWDAPDPMKELVDAHVAPGMRAKFLSPTTTTRRGARGYEIVKDDHGDPVKLGELMLAQIPEEVAEARNRAVRDRGQARVEEIEKQYVQEHQRLSGGSSRSKALAGPSLADED